MGVYIYTEDYLCFTAEQSNSTITLNKSGTPTEVNLETSTDGSNWSDYTIGDTITLTNVGDKVYWRNKSETPTGFSTSGMDAYGFSMTGKLAGSGSLGYLLCKNDTDTFPDYCFLWLFSYCTSLTTPPSIYATTLGQRCCLSLFAGCTSLSSINNLPATNLPQMCYSQMYSGCSNIKLSTTQTGEYQTPYRIPTSGTGTVGTYSIENMFTSTGGTFTGTPSINTTYYTSNTVV